MDTQEVQNYGSVLASWQIKPETARPLRSFGWHVIFFILMGLGLIYAFWTANYIFAILIVIIAFIVVFDRFNPLKLVTFKIYETGVAVDNQFYKFNEFKKFAIVYQPPQVKNLYFIRDSVLNPHMKLPLEDQDPLAIREKLLAFLPEDANQDSEFVADRIQRWLKM